MGLVHGSLRVLEVGPFWRANPSVALIRVTEEVVFYDLFEVEWNSFEVAVMWAYGAGVFSSA